MDVDTRSVVWMMIKKYSCLRTSENIVRRQETVKKQDAVFIPNAAVVALNKLFVLCIVDQG